MKKTLIIIAAATLIMLGCNKEDAPQPTPVQPAVTTTATGGGSGNTQPMNFYVWVYNIFPTTNPVGNVDTVFNSIMINGVEMVDSLKRNMSSFVIGNLNGINNTSISLYSLTFDAPTDILASPFTITIDANDDSDIGGSTAPDVFMFVANSISGTNGTGAAHDFTNHCNGVNTYTVTENTFKSTRYLLTNPCQ